MLIKPIPPLDERESHSKTVRDKAGAGAWPIESVERMLADQDEQPPWRERADKACAYVDNVDNEQLTPQQKQDAMAAGIPARAINLVGRVVNGILGQEAKTRRDPILEPDDDDFADVADVLNVRLKEGQRETDANRAVSDAYSSQVRAGLGWTEVRRNADPLRYDYAVDSVPRDQMWWDWRARKIDLSDARWVCRSQWKDLDEVVAAYPKWRKTLEQAVDSWASWFNDGPVDEEVRLGYNDFQSSTRFRQRTSEWREGIRRRLRMYHIQYRVPALVTILRVGFRKIIVDPQNPLHQEAISRGIGKLERAPTMQIRNAIYAGPFRMLDEATTLKRFSYTPFFAFRRDSDDTPFGLVESMIAPQDDYNESSQRMRWMLRAQQLLIDNDALDETINTKADIVETMMRPDMVAVLNAKRTNKDGMAFRNDFALQKELFERMQDSKMLIQDVPGVYGPQLGDAPTGVTSGIAMNTLVEQGIVAMGELNDNYMLGRRLTFENLVDLIVEDHAEADMRVRIGTGQARREVVLNTRHPETGQPMNVVKDSPVKLGLGEAPASPAYQMQTAQIVGDMIRAMAGTPHAGILIPTWIETNSMFGPNRKQVADDMRRATGLPTGGDRNGAQQWQQAQQQAAAENAQLQNAGAKAEVIKKNAEADEVIARTNKIESETLKNMAEVAMTTPADEDAQIEAALQGIFD